MGYVKSIATNYAIFTRNSRVRRARCRIWLVLCGLAPLALIGRSEAQVPQGVFSIANGGLQPQDEVLANPNVDGVTLRQDWASLEPTEGHFDFSYLDLAVANVAAAGKKVLIRIATQSKKPAWVTTAVRNAGGLFFTFIDKGVSTSIPVFWDPTFLAKKKAMITALGNHFKNNPAVAIVWVSFANATSEDWNVPHTPQYVAKWLRLGYTSDKLIDAGRQLIDAAMVAFPNQYLTLSVGGNGHVGATGNLDPTADYVARAAVNNARATWPGRLIVQKNDLSTFNPDAPGTGSLYQMIWDFQPDVGGQMVFQSSNDPSYRVNGGVPIDPALALTLSINNALSYNEKYVEIYQIDVVNLPKVITAAHRALTAP